MTGPRLLDSLRSQLDTRIVELEAEYRAGQQMLTDLETKQAELQQTLMRISGALHVLRELTQPEDGSDPHNPDDET